MLQSITLKYLFNSFMLMCHYCAEFVHRNCVELTKDQAIFLDQYKCSLCINLSKSEVLYEEGI